MWRSYLFAPLTRRQHWAPFVSDQQVVHIVRVLFLDAENAFEHDPGGRVVVAEVADELAIVLDGDPLGYEVFPNHVDQVLAFGVLRGGAGRQALRIEGVADGISFSSRLPESQAHMSRPVWMSKPRITPDGSRTE